MKIAMTRPIGRPRQFRRAVFNPMPTFTETYIDTRIQANAGGQFTTRINKLPQVGQYSGLYNQYKIASVKVMILPTFTDFDGTSTTGPGHTAPRLVYAINDTPNTPAPTLENQVLTDNGCRILTLDKKVVIRFKPVPERTTSAGGVEERAKSSPWLSFAKAGQVDPTHWGVDYFITADNLGGDTPIFFDVYYKVTFQLRDPK